jgi:hypothetical protein
MAYQVYIEIPIIIPPPPPLPVLIRERVPKRIHEACICKIQPNVQHAIVWPLGNYNHVCRGCSCRCPYTLVSRCHY